MFKHRWTLLLAAGYCLALAYGKLTLPALPTFIALGGAALLATRIKRWQRISGHLLFALLAVPLASHWLPGFHNAKVIEQAVFSAGALPFTMSLNLDKPLIGFWLLGACPWIIAQRSAKRASLLLLIVPLTLATCLGGAWSLGLIGWAAKWPEQAWLWLANNLLLVSLTEELLFRGYLQGGLQRLFGHDSLALLGAALLFGLAHLGGGWQWALVAGLAGIGYGLAYRYGGLGAAVSCHFGINLVHFAGFSYPMLAVT
ncbi:CAAX amino terminal protease [Pseudomonas reidholzensis]|uniref:CAAX amino terminal protease n=1 Tax=Pseudomonas reidholzensis TaxID=1785162 RepID=A0A383S1Y8_9PSED|nr:CPBP family intramembrane glutamic endopeptidase [Pseudomonas reidholzensis]SYX92726.1 CAAX amino terminal protease [Pseudomonas reidholzensis]